MKTGVTVVAAGRVQRDEARGQAPLKERLVEVVEGSLQLAIEPECELERGVAAEIYQNGSTL